MSARGSRHKRLDIAFNVTWGRACLPGFLSAPVTALRLDTRHCLEPEFIVFSRTTSLENVEGPDVLLIAEVTDSSPDYDLRRESLVDAAFDKREVWVIDAARRVVHRHGDAGPGGYVSTMQCGADERLVPRPAPEAFAFALDDLDDV